MKEYIQKKEGYGHFLSWLIRLCDLLLINLFFLVSYYISVYNFGVEFYTYDKKILIFLLINLSYFIVTIITPVETSTNVIYLDRVVRSATTRIVFFCAFVTAALAIFNIVESVSLLMWVFGYIVLAVLYIGLHVVIRMALKSYRRRGYNHRRIVIVGAGQSGEAIYSELKNSDFGYKIKGYFENDSTYLPNMPQYLGTLDKVEEYVLENNVDEIYCSLHTNDNEVITNLIVFSEKNMIRFFLIPQFFNFVKRRFILRFIESVPVVSMRNEPLQHLPNRLVKRAFDVMFSLFVLLFIFPPILIVVGFLIKKSSPGPLFFKQERTGFHGSSFNCYKFRSMKLNVDSDKQQMTKGDPRVTKIGAFIRKTSIDELPQFFNVLRGDMSIVGPRPHMLKHTEEYSRLIDKFMVRHLVKPGITGWAQVSGFRGETKTLDAMENRVKKDMWYIENWSFVLDLKIVFKTMFNAVKGEDNAY